MHQSTGYSFEIRPSEGDATPEYEVLMPGQQEMLFVPPPAWACSPGANLSPTLKVYCLWHSGLGHEGCSCEYTPSSCSIISEPDPLCSFPPK